MLQCPSNSKAFNSAIVRKNNYNGRKGFVERGGTSKLPFSGEDVSGSSVQSKSETNSKVSWEQSEHFRNANKDLKQEIKVGRIEA